MEPIEISDEAKALTRQTLNIIDYDTSKETNDDDEWFIEVAILFQKALDS
jgi:hypothetical protein